ncbi:alpha-N-arabinofuranosidase [Neolewinella xylanilytica]|uniref:non-reducing end alpha-L-arabinofuranosidase n=1 Tax=Neolewinella xylanilytica TaxID=1514080 RepID=A0A2S6I3U9_9BACT|nr:alpha-L-arabinofuranosidase C-terminal domain-containing protein [Neolewinella xylanilytica]PPK85872.1 alpha-N-arabinofuranosidase [Neolewinella xylanilytica]
MHSFHRTIFRASIFLFCCAPFLLTGQSRTTLVVDAGAAEHQISRHIYGHFAEHLGRNIYDGFFVGEENRTIPNTAGVRNDIIEALKALSIPNLRWPGGCFADTYHWMDGIGPKEDRPTIVNQWWGGVTEDNSFGTHDFLNLCEVLGTEPYLSANVGSGTVQEVADWIQYTNHGGESPMAKLRRENGREEPWNVKYWGVGNEAWGCGGNMTAEFYADVYRRYATFMQDWNQEDSVGIVKIASGASSNDYNWTRVLMQDLKLNMVDALALHHYSVTDWEDKGPSVEFDENQYFETMEVALAMDTLIENHTAIMDEYDPEKRIALYVDEWGGWYNVEPGTNPGFLYQQNTIRDAMIAGATLNIFNNHAERVKMANLAQAVNVLQAVILTEGEQMILTPTYHVMKMYVPHHDATLLPSSFETELTYSYEGKSLPALSASASRSDDGTVTISLVNIDASETHTVDIQLNGTTTGAVNAQLLTSDQLQDYNDFDAPDRIVPVAFTDFTVANGTVSVKLPPYSVVVLEVQP